MGVHNSRCEGRLRGKDPRLPPFIRHAPSTLGEQVRRSIEQAPPPDKEGWRQITLSFDSLQHARAKILGFGRAVEVLEPQALRLNIADYVHQTAERYRE